MKNEIKKPASIFLAGDDDVLIASVAICLLTNNTRVTICCTNHKEVLNAIRLGLSNIKDFIETDKEAIEIIDNLDKAAQNDMAIVLTKENIRTKLIWINQLERSLNHNTIIACNTESFDLNALHQHAKNPSRIIGVNWSHPVQHTYFLEIITNAKTSEFCASQLQQIACRYWKKDPYIATCGFSIRARLLCSILREGFYLIENGYANAEDIDRALRNDAGLYLSFAGNFRYMDLMGLYAYGKVMGELNPTLSTSASLPSFFDKLVQSGHLGMASGDGFFHYTEEEIEAWEKVFLRFSGEMEKIISKYPLAQAKETAAVTA
jgi:3-hydroxybutyryl-CoA dehydrogenase